MPNNGNIALKRRLLFLSFYFPPDLSAGSFRSAALIRELSLQAGDDWDIDVLTTMPNRYNTLSPVVVSSVDEMKGAKVRRIPLPAHQNGMRDQALAFLSFARKVERVIKDRHYDAVFATTSRLATGVLGAWIAKHRRVPFYLDVRDLFADTIEDVLQGSPLCLLLPAIRIAEKYAISRATRVNVVSGGFLSYLAERGFAEGVRVFPNGIDDDFLSGDFSKQVDRDGQRILLYAGNIGDGQGLHRVVPELAQRLGRSWLIRIIGDGGKRRELESELARLGIDNVERLNPIPRRELLAHYRQADVLFLHLNDYKAFRRVLPSKIFEYAATGKPILAGVSGYAADFVKENVLNAAVFSPCDAGGGISALRGLQLEEDTLREQFVARYSRHAIVREMVADMLKTFDE